MKPRPWYISLSAIWNDDQKANGQLDKYISSLKKSSFLPYHHIEIDSVSRHSTILAILRINDIFSKECPFKDFSRRLITSLTSESSLVNRLTELLGSGLLLYAYEIRVFDIGTTIQFKCDTQLSTFRESSRALFLPLVKKLIDNYPVGIIESILDDTNKNQGNHAYGSIARSPNRNDSSKERFHIKIEQPITFKFNRLHLLTSDESLNNPREPGFDDFIVGR
jgi:hypothetical protein